MIVEAGTGELIMKKGETSYRLYYHFTYEDYEDDYDYTVTFDDLMKAIRKYFDNFMINIDGKDSDVYNALNDLGCIDEIFDIMENWLHDECEEKALEEYQDWVDWYYDEEEE